jgi:PAS domain S-box-containing protein
MKVHHDSAIGNYLEHQQHLLLRAIRTTNFIFLIGALVNCIWLPTVFWKVIIQNTAALIIILIGFVCSKIARRGQLRKAVRIYLSSAIALIALIALNVGQNFILNVVLILTIFVLLSTFLESPRFAHAWGIISAIAYSAALTARIFGPFEELTLVPTDLAGFYAFPVINFVAIALIGRGAALRLSNSLAQSEDARNQLEKKNHALKNAQAELHATNEQLQVELYERQRAEKALRKIHKELEKRVENRTAELASANEDLRREIMERKQADKALRESEERFREMAENIREVFWLFDWQAQKVIYVSPAYESVWGRSTRDLYNSYDDWAESIHPDDLAYAQESFAKIVESGGGDPREYRIVRPDREVRWISDRGFAIRNEEGKVTRITGIAEDITGKKQLEDQLLQAQKLEAIGTLAGGVAHDFNNLLMGIQGHASLMLYDLDCSHPHFEPLQNIEKQVRNGAHLASQLLGYARKGKYDVQPINLNHLVEETADAFGRTRKGIVIHYELASNLGSIEADQGQIEQVLLNLYINAADAMVGGGRLILMTENVSDVEMRGKMYDPKPGAYVLLSVTDTGNGMAKETQERIFEPFFTTKEMGKGTGLGLASVYGIIKGHGGYIDVDSEIGRGTTFQIYLPASRKTTTEKAAETPENIFGGKETILLVEDEAMVLDVSVKMLGKMGYTVLSAKNGSEAIKAYNQNQKTIDMVILDMVLPEMDGGQVYDRLKEIHSDVKVLLASGYSVDSQAKQILSRGCNGFIQKPFNIKELSSKIKGVLAG